MVTTRYARSGNASIAYQTVGQGEIDIVFAPCWLSHIERLWKEPRFAQFIERLSTYGRVILFDKLGVGMSDPIAISEFPSLDERIDDLLAVLDAVGSRKVVLVGSAIGAKMAYLMAADYPDRVAGVVTFGASARGTWAPDYPWAPKPEELEQRLELLQHEWGGPVMVEAYAASLAHDPAFCRWWAECLRSAASPATAVAAERLSAHTDIRSVLPHIQAPALVLHRTDDKLVDIAVGRFIAEQIPNAQFAELPGSDHLIFTGDQDELFDVLGEFLVQHTSLQLRPRHLLATVAVIDVIDTSATAARLGAVRWAEVSDTFYQLVRSELANERGQAFDLSLDKVMATFDAPARAIQFARAVSLGMKQLGLRARFGLHTGEIEVGASGIGGKTVHLATRIAAQAGPNEVIVSDMVAGLVAGSGHSFAPVDAGETVALPADRRLFRLESGGRSSVSTESARAAVRMPSPAVKPISIVALTARERQVAALVARGQSNREIGHELSISVATAERHVSNIMTKLSVRSRAQIAVWAAGADRGWETIAPSQPSQRVDRLTAFAAD